MKKVCITIIMMILMMLSLYMTKSYAFEISDSTIMDLATDHPSESDIYCKEYGGLLAEATGYQQSITGDTSQDDGGSGAAASAEAAGESAEGVPGTLDALYTQPQGQVTNTVSNQNNTVAYTLSSGANYSLRRYVQSIGGSTDNYTTAVSDSSNGRAKQLSLWSDSSFNEGTIRSSDLFNEARDYVNYYNSTFGSGQQFGNEVGVGGNTQVIALQDSQEYLIGPFVITYPDNSKFSIMDNMYLSYSDSTGTHKAYLTKSEIIQDGPNTYPHSGHPFYIKVKASKIGYATKVTLGAQFAFMRNVYASYDRWEVFAKNIRYGSPITHLIDTWDETGSTSSVDDKGNVTWSTYLIATHYVYQATVYAVLYNQKEQTLSRARGDQRRDFGNYDLIDKNKTIDLTMNMGGRVWKDAKANDKDSGLNGLFDVNYSSGTLDEYKDELIPNVTVTLYKQGETKPYTQPGLSANPTKTDKNGNYKFTELNSMYKYYVKYTYNGQYYQPTKYLVNGQNGWKLNSKGMDIPDQRATFNRKFAEIGASPHNYAGGKSFSKTYLLGYRLQSDGTYKLTASPSIDKFGNLINSGDGDQANYVKDSQTDAYTYNASAGTMVCYPIENQFVISDHQEPVRVSRGVPGNLKVLYPKDDSYPSNNRIDLGLMERETADLALRKDVYKATTTINGKTQTYNYNKRQGLNKDSNGNEYWEISTRISDENYYSEGYTRQVYPADYNYNVNDANNSLNIYVTYKITVRNQSGTINGKLMEVVDYYDQAGYTFMGSNTNYAPYVGDMNGNKRNDATLTASTNSRYSNTQKNIPGYANEYIDVNGNNEIDINSDMYIYLTFKVNKDSSGRVLLDDNDIGKENITEINGYQTFYSNESIAPNGEYHSGNIAGLVDVDSTPGNLDSSDVQKNGRVDYTKFEDDTDKAPNIKILLYGGNRNLNGATWEDSRNVSSSFAQVGDGIRNENTKIPGMTVELWDADKNQVAKIWNGSSWQDAMTTTDQNGNYSFVGYVPGNYIVKFVYGTNNTGKYNGQDYKSTTYNSQANFDINNPDNDDQLDLKQSDSDNQNKLYKSDARDLMGNAQTPDTRENVDSYCNNGQGNVTNAKAKELYDASGEDLSGNAKQPIVDQNHLEMMARSAKIDAEIEYGRTVSDISDNQVDSSYGGSYNISSNTENNTGNYTTAGAYSIDSLDFGLEERPKAQLKTTKQVVNVKVTLANGNALFDASKGATNVLWLNHTAHGPDKTNTYKMEDNYQNGNGNKNSMKEPVVRQNSSDKGKIQLTMDEELMQGATIKVTYAIFVANVGEADYKENKFYYTGQVGDENNIVTTTPNAIIDYVGYQSATGEKATRNNLKFDKNDNPGWDTVNPSDFNSLDANVQNSAKTYNTIIENNLNNKALKPIIADQNNATQIKAILDGSNQPPINSVDMTQKNVPSVAATKLTLSQVLSSENKSDDMTYNNMTEIIKTSNTVGRRMAASIVGDQDPTKEPTEIDADDAQEITILPPFGQKYIYYVLGAGIAIILIAGIIIIKKKVLDK